MHTPRRDKGTQPAKYDGVKSGISPDPVGDAAARWQQRMRETMAKLLTSSRTIRADDIKAAPHAPGLRRHRVIRFFEPLDAATKKKSSRAFRDLLAEQSRVDRKAAPKKRSKPARG
jgi:hypothetical protein